jgi:arylsulfatase A-like enzyme
LESSIVLVTSDHGQLFERGVHGHTTPLLYEPVIHVPLLISLPDQSARSDIYTPVSSTDVLPTLAALSGQAIPPWVEGQVLPGMSSGEPGERPIFSIEAKSNPAFSRLETATIAMHKGPYKLIYYLGYNQRAWYEMYNIDEDPEELNDIHSDNELSNGMEEELQFYLEESNLKIDQ